MSRIESLLSEMGLALRPPKAPVANYLGTKRSGNLLYVSGRVSEKRGKVGTDLSTEDAKLAAKDTMLDLLAIIKADIGDLDKIVSILKLQGFVNSAASFTAQPQVIDGASELLIALYGEAGKHARTATGAAQLPCGPAYSWTWWWSSGNNELVQGLSRMRIMMQCSGSARASAADCRS